MLRLRGSVLRIRARRSGSCGRTAALLLQGLELLAELLIPVLQLLDLPGQLTDRGFEAIEPGDDLGCVLRVGGSAAPGAGERDQSKTGEADHPVRHGRCDENGGLTEVQTVPGGRAS